MLRDQDYGMGSFNLEIEGIGGRMKTTPEDFVVIEMDDTRTKVNEKPMYGGGIYLHGLIHRRDLSHYRTVSELRRFFSTNEDNIHLSGIKDKNAVVIQEFSVFNPRKNVDFEEAVLLEGLRITTLGFSSKPVRKGHIFGNWFDIIVRDISAQSDLSLLADKGTLNYYGYQRFGGTRPITATFGKALFDRDLKLAVDIYLGGRSYGEDERFRKLWRETRDPELLLNEWLEVPKFERRILEALLKTPSDYQKALEQLPRNLNHFSKMAFLSLLFNEYISRREGKPMRGEREVVYNGKKNLEIALPSNKWKEPLNNLWGELFDEYQLKINRLAEIRHSSRMRTLYPSDLRYNYTDDTLQISFSLPTGSYATTLMREIMRTNPVDYL